LISQIPSLFQHHDYAWEDCPNVQSAEGRALLYSTSKEVLWSSRDWLKIFRQSVLQTRCSKFKLCDVCTASLNTKVRALREEIWGLLVQITTESTPTEEIDETEQIPDVISIPFIRPSRR